MHLKTARAIGTGMQLQKSARADGDPCSASSSKPLEGSRPLVPAIALTWRRHAAVDSVMRRASCHKGVLVRTQLLSPHAQHDHDHALQLLHTGTHTRYQIAWRSNKLCSRKSCNSHSSHGAHNGRSAHLLVVVTKHCAPIQ